MGRYSYDDMPPEGYRERREGGRRGTFVIAFVGILLTLIAIVLYLLYTPHQAAPEEAGGGASTVEVEVPEPAVLESSITRDPVEITVEEELPVPADTEPVAAVEEASEAEAAVIEEEAPAAADEPLIEESVLESAVKPMVPSEYIVQDGDTLQSIASAYDITPETIIDFNAMSDNSIAVGDTLLIPRYSGIVYVMKPGDDLSDVVSRYNPELSAADIAKLNSLGSTSVPEGTRIFIPVSGSEIEGMPRFSSPVSGGTILMHNAEYFREKGETIHGVVIAARPGTPVTASASGTVESVGFTPDRRRYVELVHDDGYATRYTGLERILVSAGSEVDEGDAIGTIGTSSSYYGSSAILFSVSQDGIRINPETVCRF